MTIYSIADLIVACTLIHLTRSQYPPMIGMPAPIPAPAPMPLPMPGPMFPPAPPGYPMQQIQQPFNYPFHEVVFRKRRKHRHRHKNKHYSSDSDSGHDSDSCECDYSACEQCSIFRKPCCNMFCETCLTAANNANQGVILVPYPYPLVISATQSPGEPATPEIPPEAEAKLKENAPNAQSRFKNIKQNDFRNNHPTKVFTKDDSRIKPHIEEHSRLKSRNDDHPVNDYSKDYPQIQPPIEDQPLKKDHSEYNHPRDDYSHHDPSREDPSYYKPIREDHSQYNPPKDTDDHFKKKRAKEDQSLNKRPKKENAPNKRPKQDHTQNKPLDNSSEKKPSEDDNSDSKQSKDEITEITHSVEDTTTVKALKRKQRKTTILTTTKKPVLNLEVDIDILKSLIESRYNKNSSVTPQINDNIRDTEKTTTVIATTSTTTITTTTTKTTTSTIPSLLEMDPDLVQSLSGPYSGKKSDAAPGNLPMQGLEEFRDIVFKVPTKGNNKYVLTSLRRVKQNWLPKYGIVPIPNKVASDLMTQLRSMKVLQARRATQNLVTKSVPMDIVDKVYGFYNKK